MRRPRLRRSRSSAAGSKSKKAPSKKAAPRKAVPKKAPSKKAATPERSRFPDDLWFRVSTRFRAGGYWVREKSQLVGRELARGGRGVAEAWMARSPATRRRVVAVAAVVGLYAIVKFAPVPGVPCQISAAKECAPSDDAVALVPADALLYGHLTLDRDSHQYELASDYAGDFPGLGALLAQVTVDTPTPSGLPVELEEDVLPWADGDLAVAVLPGPKGSSRGLLIVGVGDRNGAEAFVTKIAPTGKPRTEEQSGSSLDVYSGGFAAAFAGDELAVGSEQAVRAALRAGAGGAEALDEDTGPRGALPDVRFADVYLSGGGVRRLLDPSSPGASQLDTFVDYGATSGMAASATARDDGIEVNVVSDLDPKLLKASPTVFSELPEFEPGLVREAGSRALAYVGVGELGPTLAGVLESAGGAGLAKSLQGLAKDLQGEAGVDPVKELLPALSGQAALVAEPTDGVPFASLIVDGVDEDRASAALAKLQGPLLKSLKVPGSGQIPRFEDKDVDGVSVRSVQISATVNLSYAVFDGKLVVSTDPAGIEQVREGGDGLAGTDAFERATDDLPEEPSALVFLNLDELLGLAEQAGLAEDPLYASLSEDISRIGSLALAVSGDEDRIRSELFLAID